METVDTKLTDTRAHLYLYLTSLSNFCNTDRSSNYASVTQSLMSHYCPKNLAVCHIHLYVGGLKDHCWILIGEEMYACHKLWTFPDLFSTNFNKFGLFQRSQCLLAAWSDCRIVNKQITTKAQKAQHLFWKEIELASGEKVPMLAGPKSKWVVLPSNWTGPFSL